MQFLPELSQCHSDPTSQTLIRFRLMLAEVSEVPACMSGNDNSERHAEVYIATAQGQRLKSSAPRAPLAHAGHSRHS